MFAKLWSGRAMLALATPPVPTVATTRVTAIAQRTTRGTPPPTTNATAAASATTAGISINTNTRCSSDRRRHGRSVAITLQPPVQRTPTQSQCARGLGHIPIEARQRPFDDDPLRLIERHVLQSRRRPRWPEPEIARPHGRPLRHEDAALDCMLQLPHVAGPPMPQQRMHRTRFESQPLLAILPRVPVEERAGQRQHVLAPIPQRW